MKYSKKNIILGLAIAFICGVLLYIFTKYAGPHIKNIYKHYHIRQWVLSFGKWDFIAFVALQVLQVVFMFVPGEVIQTSGGYIFGTLWGTVLALCGILIGAIITFFVGRLMGEHLLRRIIPKKKLERLEGLINRPKNKVVLIVLYLIPGLPKDILGYIAGITTIKFKEFVVISTVTRIPGVLASTYLGANLYHHNYLSLSIGITIISILLIIGISQKEKILSHIK